MIKESTRISSISKLDAKSLLRELGFNYEPGTKHDHYVYHMKGGEKILWNDEIQNKITIQIGRGSLSSLRPQEARSIRSALELIGKGHLWNSLIGLPMKKKTKSKDRAVPFFSRWANGFDKTFKALTFDQSITSIDETLYNLYLEEALKDNPTLTEETFRDKVASLIDLVSNNESHYISSLSTGDIITAIAIISSIQSRVTLSDIAEMLGADPSKLPEVEMHVDDLKKGGFISEDSNITLTEEGLGVSNAGETFDRLVKLSLWLKKEGFAKESLFISNLNIRSKKP